MIHFLIAAFVVAHGAVHGIMFGLPLIPKAKADLAADGFLPSNSWLALFASKWFVVGYPISIALAIAASQAQTAAE